MLLLPILSRIFAVLNSPINGTDEANTHRRLKDAYLNFFTALMNFNLDGVFITERNKPEFENLLSALLATATDAQDATGQRLAIAFFERSVTAWGMSSAPTVFADSAMSDMSKAVANGTAPPTNQHAVSREQRAAQALAGYETFIYGRLLPLCFEIPAQPKFQVTKNIGVSARSGPFNKTRGGIYELIIAAA
jgi:exportin-T